MAVDLKGLRAELEQLGSGELSAQSAPKLLQRAAEHPDELGEYVYDALSRATWRAIVSQSDESELADWHRAQKFFAGLMKRRGRDSLAERTRALYDLVSRTHRFSEAQPIEDILARKHVREILLLVKQSETPVDRETLRRQLAIGEANLSRVLSVLVGARLLRRKLFGREAHFWLSDSGRSAAARVTGADRSQKSSSTDSTKWWAELPMAVKVWDRSGDSLGYNNAFEDLLGKIGGKGEQAETLDQWVLFMRRYAEPSYDGNNSFELNLSPVETLRCGVVELADGSRMAIVHDVSDYRTTVDGLQARVAGLSAREAELTKQLHELRQRVIEFNSTAAAMSNALGAYSREIGMAGLLPASGLLPVPPPHIAAQYPSTIHANTLPQDTPHAHVDLKMVVENLCARMWPAASNLPLETNLVEARVNAPRSIVEQVVFHVATIAMSRFDPHQKRRLSNDIQGDRVVLLCHGKLNSEQVHHHHSYYGGGIRHATNEDLSDWGLAYPKSMIEEIGGGVSIDVDQGVASVRVFMPMEKSYPIDYSSPVPSGSARKPNRSKKVLGKLTGIT